MEGNTNMKTKLYLVLSASLFAVVALGHLARMILAWPVTLGPIGIPLWLSVFGVLGPGLLSAWGFTQARKA
jgi:hypothetical protein